MVLLLLCTILFLPVALSDSLPRFVRIQGRRFVKAGTNRTVVLKGPNIVVKGPPYLPEVTSCSHSFSLEKWGFQRRYGRNMMFYLVFFWCKTAKHFLRVCLIEIYMLLEFSLCMFLFLGLSEPWKSFLKQSEFEKTCNYFLNG